MPGKENPKQKETKSVDRSGKPSNRRKTSLKRPRLERLRVREVLAKPNYTGYNRPQHNSSIPREWMEPMTREQVPGMAKKAHRLTPRKKERYLMFLERYGAPAIAASKVGVKPEQIVNLRRNHKGFTQECEAAEDRYFERLQIVAMERISEGTLTKEKEKEINGGHERTKVKTTRRQSDALLGKMMDIAERRKERRRARDVIKGSISENDEGGIDFVVETPPKIFESNNWESQFRPAED